MVAGSILSIGSRTRFWIMRTRRERHGTVRDGGAHPGGAIVVRGVSIFIEGLPR
jgi:hypothetical protein